MKVDAPPLETRFCLTEEAELMSQQERVVYLLGAGFSAPLGLPIIGNFFETARSLLETRPDEFGHFRDVLGLVSRYAQVLHLYSADFFNIEEVLSLAEMEWRLSGRGDVALIADFVRDVVAASTPTFDAIETGIQPPPVPDVEERSKLKRHYADFAFNLLSLCVTQPDPNAPEIAPLTFSVSRAPQASYGIVSFNYDTVLERCAATLPAESQHVLGFQNPEHGYDLWKPGKPVLAKLHGCIERGGIIAPTWSKALPIGIERQWRAAMELLEQATQIRVIGYSLPDGDAYARYLLKAAAVSPPTLKHFDIVCLDPYGAARDRYERFVRFSRKRFLSSSVETYWRGGGIPLSRKLHGQFRAWSREYNSLEVAHSTLF